MRLYLLCIAVGLGISGAHLGSLGMDRHAALLFFFAAAVAWGRLLVRPLPSFAPDYNAKESACCPGELLVPMHSTDTKMCTGCKTERHWPLEPGQKRTFHR